MSDRKTALPINYEDIVVCFRLPVLATNNNVDPIELQKELEPIVLLIYAMLVNDVSSFELRQRLVTSVGE